MATKSQNPVKIDVRKRVVTYTIVEDDDKPSAILGYIENPIVLSGFIKLPAGFYKEGWGLTNNTSWRNFIPRMYDVFGGRFHLEISSENKFKVDKKSKKLIISHALLKRLITFNKSVTSVKNAKLKTYTLSEIAKETNEIDAPEESIKAGEIATLLSTVQDPKTLSKEDLEAIHAIYPLLAEKEGAVTKRDLKVSLQSKVLTEKIYLDQVVEYFEKNLKTSKSESFWQEFFSKNLLLFNSNYVSVVEKQNIGLKIKVPDFLLVDQFGFLDVFEIKKPDTPLLKYDKGRSNYYWSDEISRAIVQCEKYLSEISRHADSLRTVLDDKFDIKVQVIKPRAYILAGTSSLFIEKQMGQDFRLLSQSTKNIQFVLYDEYLGALKSLITKISKGVQ